MRYLHRKLWFSDQEGTHKLEQDGLLMLDQPVVVLGEPGMGKTELLKDLGAKDGNAVYRAQHLINCAHPETLLGSNSRIMIDALDEVPAQTGGGAVDLVLRKLGELGYPPFILSCRVAEWRAALSARAIADQYDGKPPIEVHLEPLDGDEQREALTELTGNPWQALALLDHFERFGLDFLGNPQTLRLIAALPLDQPLPTNSGALFEKAIETLRKEHNQFKEELPRDIILDAAGAAFSALILSGNARIVDQPSGLIDPADKTLPLSEVEMLDHGHVRNAANTKLFAADRDGLTYCHRRVGEFVGARWLAAQANTRPKRRRLIELFRSHDLVPAQLRGLHAWLARDPKLADSVIDADPMGVIEYGDAENLNPDQARRLLAALKRIAADNPQIIGWQEHRAAALVTAPLMNDVAYTIGDRKAPFGLRLLLLNQLKFSATAEGLRSLLRERMLDENEPHGIRYASALVLSSLGREDWPTHLETLRQCARKGSLRLAHELLEEIGIDGFSNEQFVRIVLAYNGITLCPIKNEPEQKVIISISRLIEGIPFNRLDSLLDLLAYHASELMPEYTSIEDNDLIEIQYSLVLKRLSHTKQVEPLRLWQWLEPFNKQSSYQRTQGSRIKAWLNENLSERWAIQRHILIDKTGGTSVLQRARQLHHNGLGLYPTQEDVIRLLRTMDPSDNNDERWRQIMRLGLAYGEEGRALREAAKRFTKNRQDLHIWIDSLADRPASKWEQKENRRKLRSKAKKLLSFRNHRKLLTSKIEDVRTGQHSIILNPAKAYLQIFKDIGKDIPAHERIAEWLGKELATAAHEGFEAFLQTQPPLPSAKDISLSYAKGERWSAGYIIVAALAERVRTRSKPFESVSNERLAAGLYECWHTAISDHAGIEKLPLEIEAELKRRSKWKQAVRLYITPQLRQQCQHVNYLWEFMHSDDHSSSRELAYHWLMHYPDMSAEAEAQMIDRLLRSKSHDELRRLIRDREQRLITDERRRNWLAAALIVDFEKTRSSLRGVVEPELLWKLRDRGGHQWRNKGPAITLSVDQLTWIIETFREQWPEVSSPEGMTSGENNPWDASEYIRVLITRLGNDVSPHAIAALRKFLDVPSDCYASTLRIVSNEQRQKLADEGYTPPTLDHIKMVLSSGPPSSAADLRAILVDELHELGRRLRGSSEDEIQLFWTDDGYPRLENDCRDRTVALLRGHLDPMSIYTANEADMPQGKRADIVFQHAGLALPLEAKRQQHPGLWDAIDKQLEAFYTVHWQAHGLGLFLVFWFGGNYPITARRSDGARPTTAAELQHELSQHPAVSAGRIEVVVLDLSR